MFLKSQSYPVRFLILFFSAALCLKSTHAVASGNCLTAETVESFSEKFDLLETEKESLRQRLSACTVAGHSDSGTNINVLPHHQGKKIRYLEEKIETLVGENQKLNDRLNSLESQITTGTADTDDSEEYETASLNEEILSDQDLPSVENEGEDKAEEETDTEETKLSINTNPLNKEMIEAPAKPEDPEDNDFDAMDLLEAPAGSENILEQSAPQEEEITCNDINTDLDFDYEALKNQTLDSLHADHKKSGATLLDELYNEASQYGALLKETTEICHDVDKDNNLITNILDRKPPNTGTKFSSNTIIQFLYNELQSLRARHQILKYKHG